jgi:hypothetical protein
MKQETPPLAAVIMLLFVTVMVAIYGAAAVFGGVTMARIMGIDL